jgi:hypothetical protein
MWAPPSPSDPSRATEDGFPRVAFAWWLFYCVGDALQQLPLVFLAPTVGAVIGTSFAVSAGSSVTIEGHGVATVPSFWDVLLPALGGAVGGIASPEPRSADHDAVAVTTNRKDLIRLD